MPLDLSFWKANRSRLLLLGCAWFVALLQLYFVSAADLTRWRGGGFGMYSDPHPNLARRVWLVGQGQGRELAVRLWPLDERLKEAAEENWRFRESLERLQKVAGRARNFPSMRGTGTLRAQVDVFLKDGNNPTLPDYFPRTDLRRVVVELKISNDWSTIDRKFIAEDPL